ncbi:NAD(P)-binding protein [Novosphingobium beihaiensis]|uniref:NAD(P)/FAD-dependent oxidoreductase n=1 Tax=Novosphingobium beihaiensis TaxID=2930389 RepID=A0ABT0BLA5_9SPHN|nr:NAD(P)/FAD-dependent oxidoreductase [Novosphingobium beihaiensis]MCJ2185824.1 NAD(P)/FAD-dependent oxidoreductase [Novosphingobium beihaiensis]
MKHDDHSLGMDCAITRRDFVNGAAVGAGMLAAGPAFAATPGAGGAGGAGGTQYPPAKTGMRGAHPGSFESAHALRDGQLDVSSAADQGELYDLVIVGGGLSGLSAAHFFHKSMGNGARVLILDNHDDFGGHAKRNQFTVKGKELAINGGTLNIEAPKKYNRWARGVLEDLGIDLAKYRKDNAANDKLYGSLNLKHAFAFDKETFGGRDQVFKVASQIPGAFGPEVFENAPISSKAKADLKRLLDPQQPDYLAGMSVSAKKEWLATNSFKAFLLEKVKIDPQAYWFFQQMGCPTFGVGGDATPALFGWVQGYPGFSGLGLGDIPPDLFADLPGGQHGRQLEDFDAVHFPDGNATVARMLVSRLVPGSTAARTQDEMGTAVFDYAKLDLPGQPTRIRLSSIAVHVEHMGDPATASEVAVRYMNKGSLKQVRGKAVILASWNMMIPYMMPQLPAKQREALAYGVKVPLVYTSVALTNWRAFAKLGVSRFEAPTMYHQEVGLTQACSLGALHHATSPDEPVALHLVKYMNVPGLPRRDQHRAGRANLLGITFEEFERETRMQLLRLLGPAGFDPRKDIAAITVNRWPHGYAYTYNSLYDPVEWVYTETPERPCVIGRQPFGLVSIANSDAAASPHTDAAMQEAHRAVQEVIERRTYPFTPRNV